MIKEKIHNIQELLKKQHIDTLLIGNFGHQIHDDLLYYLLLKHLELGIMLIPQNGVPILSAIPFEVDQLTKKYSDIEVRPLNKKIESILSEYRGTIGYRPSALPTKHYKQSYVPIIDEDKLMSRKLHEEQARLKKAAVITDDIFAKIISTWKLFETEQDVAKAIHIAAIENDVELSFPTIVASGKNAANPHHATSSKKLQTGFCVIDMGVRYQGYCSDMTRTLYIGTPSKEEQKNYQTILAAQEQAIQDVQVGATISDIARQCRKNLGTNLNEYFTHSLGHGLGTQVHEWPRVSKKEDIQLEEGMCITIEPGVYMPNAWGIRIEDDVLVSKKGPQVLTTTAKDLICV